MRRPIELLVLLCLLIGIIPGLSIGPFLHSAVLSVLGQATPEYSLSVWHGFNLPLIMSIVAMIGGILLHWMLKNYLATSEDGPPFFRHLQGQRIFERVLVTLSWNWARKAESFLSTRRLQPQLRIVVAVAVLAAAWPIFASGLQSGSLGTQPVDPIFAGLWILGGACAIGAAYQAKYHRLAALILLGGAGLVTCITFVWLSAPDLAVTQLLVEIVTTVLLLLGLRWLPKRWEDPDPLPVQIGPRIRRYRDLLLAIGSGAGVAVIAYAVMTRMSPSSIGDYFLENAYSGGGGKNVVNVILVDFRAFDTFGEIAVLGIVGLTVFALLRRFRPRPTQPDRLPSRRFRMPMTRPHPTARQAKHWLIIWPCRPSSCNGYSRSLSCWQCICSCAVMICRVAGLRPASRSQLHSCCNIWRQAREW